MGNDGVLFTSRCSWLRGVSLFVIAFSPFFMHGEAYFIGGILHEHTFMIVLNAFKHSSIEPSAHSIYFSVPECTTQVDMNLGCPSSALLEYFLFGSSENTNLIDDVSMD